MLLKNQGGFLPLKRDGFRTLAVIGPNAADTRLGSYSGEPWHKVSLLDAVRAKLGDPARVLYAEGCRINRQLPSSSMQAWEQMNDPGFATAEENQPLIDEAVRVAKDADVILLALGENETLAREAWDVSHKGDRASLDLFGSQTELANALFRLGKPVIVYLMNGKPMAIGPLAERAQAVIEGWYAGQETGTAAADILFGDVNPSGRLTISFPRSAGHIPAYYNHKPGARIYDYLDASAQPLFPFGFGLSYTTFSYSPPELSAPRMTWNGSLTVSATVTNTGPMAGEEVVQLYVCDEAGSVTRPVRELRGFQKVRLGAGESRRVTFTLDRAALAFHNVNLDYDAEPGLFKVWIAPHSGACDREARFELTR